MQDYIGEFDNEKWMKMKALASLNGQNMEEYLNQILQENINSINTQIYSKNKNYKRKRMLLEEDLHQKIKTKSYLQNCTMRDIIQSVIEKKINEAGL